MKRSSIISITLATLFYLLSTPLLVNAQAPYQWSKIRMGGKEINNTLATGTNDAGWAVGNWSGHADPNEPGGAFRFQKNKFIPFAVPGAVKTDLADIDLSSLIVGNFTDTDGNTFPFLYRHGSPGLYDVIDIPGAFWSFAYRVNSKKQIAMGYFSLNAEGTGIIWTAAIYDWNTKQVTPINIPNTSDLVVRGLNNHGETVGSYTTLDPNNPCLCQFWDNGFYRTADGEIIDLVSTNGDAVNPSSINDHGIMVGRVNDVGFRWDLNTGAYEEIPHPVRQEGFFTAITDIDNQGRMVAINQEQSTAYIESWWVRPKKPAKVASR